jgi:hypothetical protein
VVAYYLQHYTALVYDSQQQAWVSIDDGLVKLVGETGSWDDVVKKCESGSLQPSLLFYSQV